MKKNVMVLLVVLSMLLMPLGAVAAEGTMSVPDSQRVRNSLELRNRAMEVYNAAEWAQMEQLMQEIRQRYEDMKPISPANIVSQNTVFKFDTPPVIKEGRTLIPIRALTVAFGADVDWDPIERTVTVEKDGTIIVLDLDEETAMVDGESIELDTKPEIVNQRTLVPFRFILETLGYGICYDNETGVTEII